MYDPLALDRQRVDQDRLRRRADTAARRNDPPRPAVEDTPQRSRPALRAALAGLTHRHRPATGTCADC